MSYLEKARQFEFEEKAFHLGFLPTEQSNALTAGLDKEFARSTAAGVRNLQSVDRNVAVMAQKIFASAEFAQLCDAVTQTISRGGKVVFSGCGATGRLSILLEKMWRTGYPEYAGQVQSIMTGGDYALVKSVESFEDFAIFGARQVRDMQMTPADLLVAITEGGETCSVLGTVREFTSLGGKAFLLFNNPASLLREHLDRCRQAIDNQSVTVLDLSCGPMALAGSTRMQATTSEQLIASAALEVAGARLTGKDEPGNFAEKFAKLLDILENRDTVAKLAAQIDFEAEIYARNGRVTYFADDYMLDLFTDTTERSPTFMLPGFRRIDDETMPEPWAFVRNPLLPAPEALQRALGNRKLRCLEWQSADYAEMGAPEKVIASPPEISAKELIKIPVGNEFLPGRYATGNDAAVLFYYGQAADELEKATAKEAEKFAYYRKFDGFCAPLPSSRIKVYEHLAVKLQWNTVSTGTMVKLGRVTGNWMSFVAISNKKLIDRAIRLIAELSGSDYHTACVELFKTVENAAPGTPAVRETLKRMQNH